MNWGHACLAYLFLVMDTLNRGTLRQLAGPWKLLKVILFFLFPCSSTNCNSYSCKLYLFHISKMSSRFTNCTSCSCKLLSWKMYEIHFLTNYHLANCTYVPFSCKLYLTFFSCKLYLILFFLQHWALSYGLISRGVDVNLNVFLLVRAHLNGPTSNSISKIPFSQLSLHASKVSF